MENVKNLVRFLSFKLITGLFIAFGFAGGLFLVYSFQTATPGPSTSWVGAGTADNKNESTHFPFFTRTNSSTYDRTQMSLEALSKKLDSLGAILDDPFPTSTVAITGILKANIARHTGNTSKIWTRCYQASTMTQTFAALRSACTSGWAAGKPLLFLSSLPSSVVVEGYLGAPLPSTSAGAWVTATGSYVAYSSPSGANNVYANTNSQYAFYNGYYTSYQFNGFSQGYILQYNSSTNVVDTTTPKIQYFTTLGYYAPTTLYSDVGLSAGATATMNDVEVWY